MEISQEHKNKMETIIAEMQRDAVKCLKDYECYTSFLEKLCKVKGIGVFDTIKCANEEGRCCGRSFTFHEENFCECPLRRYICINFHI